LFFVVGFWVWVMGEKLIVKSVSHLALVRLEQLGDHAKEREKERRGKGAGRRGKGEGKERERRERGRREGHIRSTFIQSRYKSIVKSGSRISRRCDLSSSAITRWSMQSERSTS
jgi:hypothetical protein